MADPRRISRRLALTGAAGAATTAGLGVAGSLTGVLPGRIRLRRALGLGEVETAVPDAGGTAPTYATFDSAARNCAVTWGWSVPPQHSADGLPIVVVLHGRGDDAHAVFEKLGAHQFLAQGVAEGVAPVGIAAVDGGSTYWHPRADGDNPLAMLQNELLPRLRREGFDTDRFAVLGYSMGGFGSLLIALQASRGNFGRPGHLRAAVASSPALFPEASATSAGSFDDADDFARWGNLVTDPGVTDIPLSVSCGTDDPFCEQTRRYRDSCSPAPAGSIGRGTHNMGYWRSLMPSQLAWLGTALDA